LRGSAFSDAIALDPTCAEAFADRADLQAQCGKLELAIADWTAALRFAAVARPILAAAVLAHCQSGNTPSRSPTSRHRIKIDPAMLPMLTQRRADARYAKGDLGEALVDYTQALGQSARTPALHPARRHLPGHGGIWLRHTRLQRRARHRSELHRRLDGPCIRACREGRIRSAITELARSSNLNPAMHTPSIIVAGASCERTSRRRRSPTMNASIRLDPDLPMPMPAGLWPGMPVAISRAPKST